MLLVYTSSRDRPFANSIPAFVNPLAGNADAARAALRDGGRVRHT